MRFWTIGIVTGALLLFAVQVVLFGGYTRELTSLTDQVSQSRDLHQQLRNALESNANLSRLFTRLNLQLGDILGEDSVGREEFSERNTKAALRGSSQILGSSEAQTSQDLAQPQQRKIYPSGNEAEACVGGAHNVKGVVAAVVTVAFNRPDYLQRHISSLLRVHGGDRANRRKFPLFISQDGTPVHEATQQQAQSYEEVSYLHHRELIKPVTKTDKLWDKIAYYRIANHYRWIFQTMFECFQYPRLIILEDDMELAPDFFPYFEALVPVLDQDERLLCISSWNDHGQEQFVRDTRRLFRTDFFPGLGWMLRRQLWEQELGVGWPEAFWDDWLRDNRTRQGRHCIAPEVCRNYNFGREGSSKGQYFDTFLAPTRLNDDAVPWPEMDLSYLQLHRFDTELEATLEAAPVAETVAEAQGWVGDVRLLYHTQEHFEALAKALGIMKEWRDGVPRAAYKGVVTIRFHDARIFIVPSPELRSSMQEGIGHA